MPKIVAAIFKRENSSTWVQAYSDISPYLKRSIQPSLGQHPISRQRSPTESKTLRFPSDELKIHGSTKICSYITSEGIPQLETGTTGLRNNC